MPRGTLPADGATIGDNEPSAALAAAEAKAAENRNSYLRAVAELDNFRKRSEREIDNARKFAVERFAQELVTVGDALEAGISAGAATPRTGPARGSPGDVAPAAPGVREGRYQAHRPGWATLRPGVARGDGGPGKP